MIYTLDPRHLQMLPSLHFNNWHTHRIRSGKVEKCTAGTHNLSMLKTRVGRNLY